MVAKRSVLVYLHTTLIKYAPDGRTRKFSLEVNPNTTIRDLIKQLGIDHLEEHLLLAVNGKVADEDQTLEDQDQVHLMMPISGG